MAWLFGDSFGLANLCATFQNTLLMDDMPYQNIKNNSNNVVHSVTFIQFIEMATKSSPYLMTKLWPFLRGLEGIEVIRFQILKEE
jgi:hypothetical protein